MAAAKRPSNPKIIWRAAVIAPPGPMERALSFGIILTRPADHRDSATSRTRLTMAMCCIARGETIRWRRSMAAAKHPSNPNVIWRAASIVVYQHPVERALSFGIILTSPADRRPSATWPRGLTMAMCCIVSMLAALHSTSRFDFRGIPDCTTQAAVNWTAGRVLCRQRRGNEQKQKRHVASHHVEGWLRSESLMFQL